ncbi:Uroporphyrinogen decarboxylase [subsurface metagenome]
MNSRERVFLALQHKEPDRVPKLEWLIDPEVIQGINKNWSYADLIDNTVEDAAVAFWDVKMEKMDEGTYIDEWGIKKCWTKSSKTYPIPVGPSIKSKKELDDFIPPDPLADRHFKTLRGIIDRFKGKKAVVFFAHDAWEYPSAFRGTEKILVDFIEDPDFATRVIDMVVNFQDKMVEKAISLGAEIIATGDDYCSTQGPIISPTHFKQFILPGLQKIVDTAKRNGALFIKHCDGNVWPLMDMIVETGIDGFHPIQPDVMDIKEFKKRYGHKIALLGNIDCGDLLCNGSPGEVEHTVKQTIKDIAPGGGYIVASSNCIYAGVKPQNYLAMLKAVKKYGTYPIQ